MESYKVRRALGDNASMSAADGISATAAGSGSGSGGPGWAMVINAWVRRKNGQPAPFLFRQKKGCGRGGVRWM